MRKKWRKFKKLIYSHQVETFTILISLIICTIFTLLFNWYIIPIMIILDISIFFRAKIIALFRKIFKFKKKENIEERSKKDMVKKLNKEEKKTKKEKVKKQPKEKKEKKKKKKGRIFKILLMIFLIGIIVCFIGAIAFWMYIAKNAPKFNEDNLYKKESSILYDKDGEIFAKLGSEFREKITYDELPEVLINAIIATEDSRFFQHNGFDLPRFVKASVGQVMNKLLGVGGNAGGASTLTMQISKNAFTSTESEGIEGIIRKFTDIYVSINEIEKNYTKEQIIEFYVNSYCLGGSIYGVEQASLSYFGKSAKDLNLSEAAIIAGLFQAPNAYSPIRNPENAAYRRNIVLTLMVRHGYITQEEADIANAIPVESLVVEGSSFTDNVYQGFIDTVVSEVKRDTGNNPYTTPMEIYTTMDRGRQDIVNAAMNGEIYAWENEAVDAGVSVLDTKTGAIVAIGTGRDTSGIGLLNHATFENQTKRHIGSTAKPLYDYGPAIEFTNLSPYNYVADEPYTYSNGPKITNWDGRYAGLITSRYALADSRNVPALKTFQKVKNKDILSFVTGLGLSPEISGGSVHEAHAIGGYTGESPLTVSGAYAAFGNGGIYNEPHSYTKLIYRDTGEELINEYTSQRAMKESTAYITYDMLVTTGQSAMRGYRYINGWTYAAKTGTSNFTEETKQAHGLASDAINDLWCTGVTDEYTISVWYGYDKISNQHYTHFLNSNHIILLKTIASRVWTRGSIVQKPDSVVSVTVETNNYDEAKLPSKYTPADRITTELFVKGSEPTEVSTNFRQLSNPTNLTSSYEDGVVTLSWDKIENPRELDVEYWKTSFSKLFKDPNWLADAANNHYNYYANTLGGIAYDIYLKTEDGLELIDTTTEDEIDINITSAKKDLVYVVKTSWANYDTTDSDGVLTTVKMNGSEIIVTVQLVGSNSVEIEEGTSYATGIKVLANNEDVTSKASITYSIIDSEDKQVGTKLTDISTLEPGTYTLKYTAKYSNKTKNISRTIIIKEKKESE